MRVGCTPDAGITMQLETIIATVPRDKLTPELMWDLCYADDIPTVDQLWQTACNRAYEPDLALRDAVENLCWLQLPDHEIDSFARRYDDVYNVGGYLDPVEAEGHDDVAEILAEARANVIATKEAEKARWAELARRYPIEPWSNSAALAGKAASAPEPVSWLVRDISEIFAPLEPVKYLLEPLDICPGAPTLVAGYGFSSKTVSLQSMGVSVASGQRVWSCFTARHGRVIHIDYEQGFRLTRERYQRLAAGMMVTPDELRGRLSVVPMPQIYLDNPAHETFLAKAVEGYDMAIVDSLRACGPSIEENDSSVRGLLDMLNRISDRTGCCFIVIHHARKPARDGANAGGAKMAIRGSGAIFDACSSVLILEAEKGKPTKVTHEKARTSGICADDFLIKVEDQEVDGNPRGGLVVTAESCAMAGSAAGAFDAIKKRLLAELANGAAASKSALAARVTGNSQAKYGAIAQLIMDGKIIENGGHLELPQ